MNFKLLALFAFATAVTAAPASEDVLADLSDPHSGAPETTGTRFSTLARDDHVQAKYFQARSNSYDPRQDNQCTIGYVQCCDRLQKASLDDIQKLLAEKNYLGVAFDPATTPAMVGVDCISYHELFDDCSSTTVCCNNAITGGYLAIGCRPVSFK